MMNESRLYFCRYVGFGDEHETRILVFMILEVAVTYLLIDSAIFVLHLFSKLEECCRDHSMLI